MPASALSIASGRTVFRTLEEGCRRHPARELLVFEDTHGRVARWTWQEAYEETIAVAAWLVERGIRPADRVHLHLPNRPEFLFAWFAAARIGAAIVPTNPLSSVDEVRFVIEHAGVALSITDAAGQACVAEAAQCAAVPWVDCDEQTFLGRLPSDIVLPGAPTSDVELSVMYTSGTTSRPKGVRVTNANYVYAGEVVAKSIGLRADDRFLVVLPLFHGNAQYYATLGTIVAGGTLVLLHGFSASRYFDAALRHDATVGSLFAAPIRMILAKPGTAAARAHRLRLVLFAQNLTDDELRNWDERFEAPLVQIYGMTETVGPPLMNPVAGGRRDAIGRPSIGYAVRVVREDGSPTAIGEPGELLVGGQPGVSLMAGYLDDAEATDAVLVDGWLRTGDIVCLEADGLLRFVDRHKDMIKRAGENIAASEVETVLMEHPNVCEAAVIGAPDPIRDEQIIAFVVCDDPWPDGDAEASLKDWCASRMARFRVPSHVVVTDALPRTSVGKVRKAQLRAIWALPDHDGDRHGPLVDEVAL